MKNQNNFNRYMGTYSGQKLQSQLDKVAIWEIRGEDPNCDMGGSHYQPRLGTVQGKLRDVIEYAVELKNFWAWGGGGDFIEVKVQTIADMAKRADLIKEKEDLERRIAEIDQDLPY